MERRELEARGHLVTGGFVDLHAHLREPGFEDSETIASGARAALRGGFTTICAMPNTQPVVDSPGLVSEVVARAKAAGGARVLPIATISRGRAGRELADLVELSAAGAVAFSDDGSPVDDARLFRHALEYARAKDLLIIEHAQDVALSGKGVMHEGVVSARLGLPGIPSAAEEAAVSRDIAIAEMTGARLHLTHISTRGAIASIRDAKSRGIRITCDVTPHHLSMTDDWVGGARELAWEREERGREERGREERGREASLARNGPAPARDMDRLPASQSQLSLERPPVLATAVAAPTNTATPYDSSTKVNPPLRTWSDVRALWEGLQDGTVDAIATDHAPHASVRKDVEFDQAAFGISGLETALSLVLGGVDAGWCDRDTAIRALTTGPAAILGLAPSDDWIAIDLDAEWTVTADALVSLGKNTPLLGRALRGRVVYAVVGGQVRYEGGLRGATPVGSR